MANTVLIGVTNRIATLTLNRPAHLNALSVEMMDDLLVAVRELRDLEDVDVVVITGAGDHFMAGGDLKDFATQFHLGPEDRKMAFRMLVEQQVNPAVEILQSLRQPVIAKVR